jgi:3-dehydroquinate synthase
MNNPLKVNLPFNAYEILIGQNWINALPEYLSSLNKASTSILISDNNVFPLYGEKVLQILHAAGFQVKFAIIEAGEENKNLATLEFLYNKMLDYGLDRNSSVIALGGGIVGDVAGFAAATYMRGISCLQIPTTLLAQVDSSIGGKTGVNLTKGKNLVGAFHQPKLVFIDIDFLKTLPKKEFLTGLAEIIKYGIIWDNDLFTYLETHQEQILANHSPALMHIIKHCCAIKAEIVSNDEKEAGLRALLNLGHTFGHAFETLTNYSQFTHGEAVAIGTVYAARLANHLGYLPSNDKDRILKLISSFGLPTDYGTLNKNAILQQMYKDKKSSGGKLKLILPEAIGKSDIFSNIDETAILKIL